MSDFKQDYIQALDDLKDLPFLTAATKMSQRISFRVHGEVQGVSYRYFTQKKANEYGLTGWVRNAPEGKVEGEAQGDSDSIQKLLKDLDRGPTHAHVVKLEKQEQNIKEGESRFEIRT